MSETGAERQPGTEWKPGLRCQHCGRAYPGLHGPCPNCGQKTAQRLINYTLYENTSAASIGVAVESQGTPGATPLRQQAHKTSESSSRMDVTTSPREGVEQAGSNLSTHAELREEREKGPQRILDESADAQQGRGAKIPLRGPVDAPKPAGGTPPPNDPATKYPVLVVCALIVQDGKVLVERRAPTGVVGLDRMFDLPGGKVENGEAPRDAIVRELQEELGITVEALDMIPELQQSAWDYGKGVRHWILAVYRCRIMQERPDLQWMPISELNESNTLAVDLDIIRRYAVVAGGTLTAEELRNVVCRIRIPSISVDEGVEHLKHFMRLSARNTAALTRERDDAFHHARRLARVIQKLEAEIEGLKGELTRLQSQCPTPFCPNWSAPSAVPQPPATKEGK